MKKSVLFFAMLFVWLSVSAVGLGECIHEGFRYSLRDDGTCTLTAPAGSRSEVFGEIVIPSTVSHNGRSYQVTAIGRMAFYKCLNLKSVKFQPTSISLACSAFEGCKNLESVSGVTATVIYPQSYAFKDCSSLSEIINIEFNLRQGNNLSLPIDDGVFQDCSKLKTVVLTSNSAAVSHYFFKGCTELSDIVLPSSVQSIGESAFEGCRNLKSINLSHVTFIYDHAFAWSGLTSVNLSASGELYYSPFLGCHDLRSVYIGSNMKTYGYNPFMQCINLTQITVSEDNPNYLSRDNCLWWRQDELNYELLTARADMDTYKIPSDFNHPYYSIRIDMWSGALSNCTNLTRIDNLPGNYKDCSGKLIVNDDGYNICQTYGPNKTLSVPFTYDGERLKIGISPNGIVGSYNLESVTLDDDVTIFDNYGDKRLYAFSYCTALKTVRISNSIALERLEGFEGCTSLTSLEVGDNIQRLNGFNDCRSLENFVFPSHLENIFGFNNCTNLKSVIFPDGIKDIAGFGNCTNLRDVKIPANVKSLSGFNDCLNLAALSLSEGLESLSGFSSTSLNTVTIPGSCKTMKSAFNSCDELETVELMEGIFQISQSFSFCDKLKSISFPNTLTTVSGFNNCYGLESVKLGINVQTIGSNSNSNFDIGFSAKAFDYCPNLKRFISSVRLEDFEGAFTGDYFDEFVIGPSAKKSCDIVNSAKKIYSTALTPPTIENSQKYDGNAELYIRSEAYNAYMSTSPWKQFPAEKVHRLNEIKEVVLDVETVKANPGSSFKITYTLKPADADLPYVYWQSSNPEIASVDDDGVVTFHQSQDSDQETAFTEYANEGEDDNPICEIQAFTLYSTEPVAVLKIINPSSSIGGTNENTDVKTGDVYNLQGILIRKNAPRDEVYQLPAGIYIYGGAKVRVD